MTSEKQESLSRGSRSRTHLLTVTAILSCYLHYLRFAPLITQPRLWAEEGWVFFPALYGKSLLECLSYVYYRSGYYNLVPNITTYLTQFFSFSYAPLITTSTALLIQLFPILLIVLSRSKLFTDPTVKILAIVIYTLSPLELLETWANTINSQIYLGISVLLIAIDDFEQRRHKLLRYFYYFTCTLAVLTGPYAFCVLPALVVRLAAKRKIFRPLPYIFAFGLVIQIISFYFAHRLELLNPKRSFMITQATLYDVLTLQFVESLIGKKAYEILSFFLGDPYMALLGVLPIALLAAALLYSRNDREILFYYLTLLLTLFTGVALTALTSFHGRLSDRYVVFVGLALNIFIATLVAHKNAAVRLASLTLLTFVLLFGISEFRYDLQSTPCNAQSIRWKKAIRRLEKKGNPKLPVCPPTGTFSLAPDQIRIAQESLDDKS